jgi:hypothetical protein
MRLKLSSCALTLMLLACGQLEGSQVPSCVSLGQVCGGDLGDCCDGLTCYQGTCQLRPSQCQSRCLDGYNACVAAADSAELLACNQTERYCEKRCPAGAQ